MTGLRFILSVHEEICYTSALPLLLWSMCAVILVAEKYLSNFSIEISTRAHPAGVVWRVLARVGDRGTAAVRETVSISRDTIPYEIQSRVG